MLDGLGGEIVLDDNGGVEGGEVDLMHLLVDPRLWLEDHASLIAGLQLRNAPQPLWVSLPEGHGQAPAQSLEDLIGGDERARCEAGGQIWRQAGEPGGHENALQAALGINEALCRVYEHPPLGDEGGVLVLDLAVAPVGLGGHGLKEAGAADGRLQAVSSRSVDHERDPGISVRSEDQVGVVGPDQVHEVREDFLLRSLQPSLAAIQDLYARDLSGQGRVSSHPQLQAG